jgi:hypothetical protein
MFSVLGYYLELATQNCVSFSLSHFVSLSKIV